MVNKLIQIAHCRHIFNEDQFRLQFLAGKCLKSKMDLWLTEIVNMCHGMYIWDVKEEGVGGKWQWGAGMVYRQKPLPY